MDYIFLMAGVIAAVGVVAYSVKRFFATDTKKVMTAFENSASVAFGRVVTFVGGMWTAVVHSVQENASLLASDNFSGLVKFLFDNKAAGAILLGVGLYLDYTHNREVQKLPPGSPSNNG